MGVKPSEELINDLLESLDNLFGLHPGFRPAHAKGVMCHGTFTPGPDAAELTKAPHIQRSSIPVLVRFSNFAGVPTIPDNDPNGAGPRGFAIRFYLADHVHTDIVGHSHDGFPTRTGEEFLELARALVASGPNAEKPTALDKFFAGHPKAKQFLEAPKPIPSSYTKESYFGVNAVKFTNEKGESNFGRYRIKPTGGTPDYLSADEAAKQSENFLSDEMSERLSKGPCEMQIYVQLAETGDNVNDATELWPDTRKETLFGTFTLTERAYDADPELRKIIFDPIPRVDGIEPSDDPLIEVRSEIYLKSGRRRRQAQHS